MADVLRIQIEPGTCTEHFKNYSLYQTNETLILLFSTHDAKSDSELSQPWNQEAPVRQQAQVESKAFCRTSFHRQYFFNKPKTTWRTIKRRTNRAKLLPSDGRWRHQPSETVAVWRPMTSPSARFNFSSNVIFFKLLALSCRQPSIKKYKFNRFHTIDKSRPTLVKLIITSRHL